MIRHSDLPSLAVAGNPTKLPPTAAPNYPATTGLLLLSRCFSSVKWIHLWIVVVVFFVGCNSSTQTSNNPATGGGILTRGARVAAQGQLSPASGIVRIAGTPGDRISEVRVQAGDLVDKGSVLVQFASRELRTMEIDVAKQKLQEAEQTLASKKLELEGQILAAEQEVKLADIQLQGAIRQLELAQNSKASVDLANKGIERMERLVRDPATSQLIPRNDVEKQQLQQQQISSEQMAAELSAERAVKLAELQADTAKKKLEASRQSQQLVIQSSPIGSLTKQLQLLELQLQQTQLTAPATGKILRVDATAGGSVGTTPVIEFADISKMVCNAEVSEIDIQRIKVGQKATLTSPALSSPLTGTLQRIQPIIGVPQFRPSNPLAPVDFRVISVTIELDDASAKIASQFIQLQVDVTIDVISNESAPP
jgi:HlyD family secretion protein